MENRRTRNLRFAILIIGILLMLVPVQQSIHKARPDLFDPNRPKAASTVSIGPTPVVIASLGGFRNSAADLLWLQVEKLWDGGNWAAIPPLLDAVTQLDPHFILAWQVYGWHLAYNLHAESETQVDKNYWLDRGVKVLEDGVAANPDNWEMIFELGWTLYDRAHEPWRAAEYFRKADEKPGAKAYVARLIYRCYEGVLDFENLFPALHYAQGRHNDPNVSGDNQHQTIVKRDLEWWTRMKDDPNEHRRQIVRENSARAERSRPFYLYPNDPYWSVCPVCGLPSPKGSAVCSVCHAPMPQTSP
jgi:hypothetical protein